MAVRVVAGALQKKGRHYDKTFATALTGEGKQANHAFGVMEIHPYPRRRQKGCISSSEARLFGFRCRQAAYILIAVRRYLPL